MFESNPNPHSTEQWFVVHTKPRQEERAFTNLVQQGYRCYLPRYNRESIKRGQVHIAPEPLFPRYLFIELDPSLTGKSWGPVRSTLGVQQLVRFGMVPATVSAELIELLQHREHNHAHTVQSLFTPGDSVTIKNGPFAGLTAVYGMAKGEQRSMVFIEILNKSCKIALPTVSLARA